MNKVIAYATVTLCHRKHPLQFSVGVGFQGNLINGRVKGIDLNKEREALEKFNQTIRDKELFEIIVDYRGMESLANFYLKNLNREIDFIIIKENNTEEVLIEK